MPRPATRKKGAYTRAEIQRRYRQRKKREQIDPKTAAKQQRRADRELQLAEKTIAASTALGSKLYGVIYCDPPWRFEPYSRETGMGRSAENHYPTLGLDGLKALNVPAAKDCVLFLWTTDPMLDAAIDLIRAWGFTRKATRIWIKDRLGTGYWHQNQAEFLLIATKGKPPAPAPGEQPSQIVLAPRGEHSAKPEVFAQDIARQYPNVPKLEMFARRPREGWDNWGNEV
jgi:N6-adenosine-specific RNA methylase IME4